MDPEETLNLAEDALEVGDYDVALDYLNEYRAWRDKGGFEPDDGDSRESDLRIALGQRTGNPPYKPPAPGNLPKHGKDILKNVYVSARERGFEQEAAARQAWCAVKRYYYKRGSKWTKRKTPISPSEYPPGCGPPTRKTMKKKSRKKNQGRHYESSEWVEFILDGFPETMEMEDVEPEITAELQAEVDRFTAAVDKAIEECSKQFPPEESLYGSDENYYLIYQTLVGAGVGIWDGSWDHYYPNKNDLKTVRECLEANLQKFADITGGGSLNEAFMDAVYAAEMPEDDVEYKKMKPTALKQLKNKLMR